MPTKLKIKMGHIEFEYEGDAAYDSASVKDLFTHLETLKNSTPSVAPSPPSTAGADPDSSAPSELSSLAPNSVAARLKAKTATDVAIAAAAHLQICVGKQTFTRDDLRTTMHAETNYFTTVMASNLSATLKSLIGSKRINSLANNQMSLSADEIASLKAQLA